MPVFLAKPKRLDTRGDPFSLWIQYEETGPADACGMVVIVVTDL